MKKTLLAAALLSLVGVFAAPPAQAEFVANRLNCSPTFPTPSGPESMCVRVYWTNYAGGSQGTAIKKLDIVPTNPSVMDRMDVDYLRYEDDLGQATYKQINATYPAAGVTLINNPDAVIHTDHGVVSVRVFPRVENRPDPGWMVIKVSVDRFV